MAGTKQIRNELGDERMQLTDAVGSLREELGRAAERGRKVGLGIAAAGSIGAALRFALRRRRGR